MLEPDLIELFVEPLNRLELRCLVSGSVASTLYGEPRVTHDIDLIIMLSVQNLPKFREAYPAPAFYVPPSDVMAMEIARETRGHFNIIHSDSGLKADFYTANRDVLHAWAFDHATRYEVGAHPISIAPPEYVIVRKLEYFREGGSEKHLKDIRGMLAVSGARIDQPALHEWITRFGLDTEWRKVRGLV